MRRLLIIIVAALVVVAILAAYGWPANEFVHDDFVGFWVGSRMLLDGADPYDPQAFRAMVTALGSHGLAMNVPGVGYGYPLTTALVFAPFALLPFGVAAPLWLVTQVVLTAAALVLLARTLLAATIARDRPVLLALAAASQPAWVLAASGNVGGFLLAIAASASALLVRRQALAAGAIAGLLVLKPHPLLIAGLLITAALPRRDALRAAAGAVATGGLVTLASIALRPGWVSEFLVSVRGLADAPIARGTLFGALMSFGPLAWAMAAALVIAFLVWELRARPPLPLVIAAAIPVSLITVPYLWSYDHSALLASAAFVLAASAARPPATRIASLALLGVAAVVLPWTLYWIAFRRGDEAWSVAVPIVMLGVVALVSHGAAAAAAPEPVTDGYGTMTS